MQNYVDTARKIITDCFTAQAPSYQLEQEAAKEQKQGHITEGYARELTTSASNERRQLCSNASAQLDGLLRKFAVAASAADMPDGNALQGGDYKLLAENFPMSVEEYKTLVNGTRKTPQFCAKPWSTATSTEALRLMLKSITALPRSAPACLRNSSTSAARCWMQSPPTPPAVTPIGT